MDFSQFAPTLTSQPALLAAIGLGTLLIVLGVGRALTDKGPAAIRMGQKTRVSATAPNHALSDEDRNYGAFTKALLPGSEEERFAVTIALAKAGLRGGRAVAGFYMSRFLLGLGLPVLFLMLLTYARTPGAPSGLNAVIGGISTLSIAQIVCVLCGIGFFGPSMWLRSKIAERHQAITEAFPNALDLIQIGVEAGLGFDQALIRMATEIRSVAPDLSDEILLAQNEIQAGRDRDRALMHMARIKSHEALPL